MRSFPWLLIQRSAFAPPPAVALDPILNGCRQEGLFTQGFISGGSHWPISIPDCSHLSRCISRDLSQLGS